jgi:hypothetical protein
MFIVQDFFPENLQYLLSNKISLKNITQKNLLKKPLTCFTAFYDTSKNIITSEKYYHKPKIETHLTNIEALKSTRQVLLHPYPQTTSEKENYQNLYSDIPHLQTDISPNTVTTY